jgi:hypothetical protein
MSVLPRSPQDKLLKDVAQLKKRVRDLELRRDLVGGGGAAEEPLSVQMVYRVTDFALGAGSEVPIQWTRADPDWPNTMVDLGTDNTKVTVPSAGWWQGYAAGEVILSNGSLDSTIYVALYSLGGTMDQEYVIHREVARSADFHLSTRPIYFDGTGSQYFQLLADFSGGDATAATVEGKTLGNLNTIRMVVWKVADA